MFFEWYQILLLFIFVGLGVLLYPQMPSVKLNKKIRKTPFIDFNNKEYQYGKFIGYVKFVSEAEDAVFSAPISNDKCVHYKVTAITNLGDSDNRNDKIIFEDKKDTRFQLVGEEITAIVIPTPHRSYHLLKSDESINIMKRGSDAVLKYSKQNGVDLRKYKNMHFQEETIGVLQEIVVIGDATWNENQLEITGSYGEELFISNVTKIIAKSRKHI